MHRLTKSFLVLALASSFACGGKKQPENPSAGTPDGGEDQSASSGGTGDGAETKQEVCAGFDLGNLEDLLAKVECEVPNASPDSVQNVDTKGKLEVTVTASPTKVAPGGKADLLVTFANKTKEPLPLQFRIDPVARFESETYDAKGKRADMPPGKTPPPPKGYTPPPPAEPKVGKVTVAPNGSARVRVPWEAAKMKWAPQKVRGSAVEKGYPREPAGPLAKGKYTVKVVTPLLGVLEGDEHQVTAPKVEIEVAP